MSLETLNDANDDEARALLTRCCGSRAWVERMLQGRPFPSLKTAQTYARQVWEDVSDEDVLEAMSHHPKIGEKKSVTGFESSEQSGVDGASEEVLRRLAEANREYEARFGFVFLVFATGKTAAQMLELLEARLTHTRAEELYIARGEQAKITRVRLEKLLA